MDLIQMFSLDSKKLEGGVVIPFGKNRKGQEQEITLRPAVDANTEYTAKLTAIYTRYSTEMSIGLGDAVRQNVEAATREAYAECCIVGWKNLLDDKGNEIEYSAAAATKLVTDYPQLYNFLLMKSKDIANFREAEIKAEEKN